MAVSLKKFNFSYPFCLFFTIFNQDSIFKWLLFFNKTFSLCAIRLCCTSPATKTTGSLTIVPIWGLQKVKRNIIWKVDLSSLLLYVFSLLLISKNPKVLFSTSNVVFTHSKQKLQSFWAPARRLHDFLQIKSSLMTRAQLEYSFAFMVFDANFGCLYYNH